MSAELKARLRKLSAEARQTGSAESKENCMDSFLEEVEEVLSHRMLRRLDDTHLKALYVAWLKWGSEGAQEEERKDLLCQSTLILPAVRDVSQASPGSDNVVSLFGG